jgi:hypothetical protein
MHVQPSWENKLLFPRSSRLNGQASYDCVIGHLGQARLGAPRSRAEGVPLHRGIPPSVNSPPRPPEETRLRMPVDDRSHPRAHKQ